MRAAHPKANHVAYAFLLGDPKSETAGMSDAGEPRGTAGRPMLAILRGSGVRDVVITVTRYFGGVKLGTGGLARAYGETTRAVLEALPTRPRVSRSLFTVEVPYDLVDVLKNKLRIAGVTITALHYETSVMMDLTIDDEVVESVEEMVADLSRGQCRLE